MSVLTLFSNEQTQYISLRDFANPEAFLDDFNPDQIFAQSSEIKKLVPTDGCKQVSDTIQPCLVLFGMRTAQVNKLIRKPTFILDNSKHIPTHTILMKRRKAAALVLATQYHFVHDQLFLVVETFNRQKDRLNSALNTTMNGYLKYLGENCSIKEGIDRTIQDQVGNYLKINYQNNLVVTYYCPAIFNQNSS